MPRKSKGRNGKIAPHNLAKLSYVIVLAAIAVYSVHLAIMANSNFGSVNFNYTMLTPSLNSSKSAPFVQALNITLHYTGTEIGGKYGYWALANYTRTIHASSMGNNTYLLSVQLNGTWRTFAGAISPNNLTKEPINGSGPFIINYTAIQKGVLNTSAQAYGYIGSFNMGGTAGDVLKGYYRNQTGSSLNAFSWTARYFNFTGNLNATDYTAVFRYGNQTYEISLANITSGTVKGNIVT
ncbi:MAG: hypothetical protein ACYCO0_02025 [Candidatus Micrarchaeaceae archaeon]